MNKAMELVHHCKLHGSSCVNQFKRCEYYKSGDIDIHCLIGHPETWEISQENKEGNSSPSDNGAKVTISQLYDKWLLENSVCGQVRSYVKDFVGWAERQ